MTLDLLMPALSPGMEEGTLAKWCVREGDRLSVGDVIAEIETDKTTLEFEAESAGVLTERLVAEGTSGIRVNTPIARLAREDVPAPGQDANSASVAPTARIAASPAARRMAAERDIDLAGLQGSGPGGRIVLADLETPERPAQPTGATPPDPATRVPDTAASAHHGGRQASPASIPLRREACLDPLVGLRSDMNRQIAPRGIRLSLTDFVIKACALALQSCCGADPNRDDQTGIAPQTPRITLELGAALGLVAIEGAAGMTLGALSQTRRKLLEEARERDGARGDAAGGGLAICNLGRLGVESFDAPVSPPHGATLAVGALRERPVATQSGLVEMQHAVSLALSVDPEALDIETGARLLAAIVHNLENPLILLA